MATGLCEYRYRAVARRLRCRSSGQSDFAERQPVECRAGLNCGCYDYRFPDELGAGHHRSHTRRRCYCSRPHNHQPHHGYCDPRRLPNSSRRSKQRHHDYRLGSSGWHRLQRDPKRCIHCQRRGAIAGMQRDSFDLRQLQWFLVLRSSGGFATANGDLECDRGWYALVAGRNHDEFRYWRDGGSAYRQQSDHSYSENHRAFRCPGWLRHADRQHRRRSCDLAAGH